MKRQVKITAATYATLILAGGLSFALPEPVHVPDAPAVATRLTRPAPQAPKRAELPAGTETDTDLDEAAERRADARR